MALLFPAYNVNSPNPAPALPSNADVFTPTFANYVQSIYAPIISSVTSQGFKDNVINVVGDAFDNVNQNVVPFTLYSQTTSGNGGFTTPTGNALTYQDAILTLASTLPSGMYLLWGSNGYGYGNPVAINQTDAWWIGSNVAASGDTISIFGNNLSYGGSTPTVYIQHSGIAGVTGVLAGTNNYKLDLPVPVGTGLYQVWVHNGHGGNYGWSGPLALSVVNGTPHSNGYFSGNVFNVKTYGAVGNGIADDTQAILSGITAASASASTHGNAVVYFPSGTYGSKGTTSNPYGLSMMSNVLWSGDGIDISTVQCIPGWNGYALVNNNGSISNFGIKNMTLSDNFNLTGTNSSVTSYALVTLNSASYMNFEKVKFINQSNSGGLSNGSNFDTGGTPNCSYAWFTNCVSVGSYFSLTAVPNVFISGIAYSGSMQAGGFGDHLAVGVTGTLSGGVGQNLYIINSTFQDLNSNFVSGTSDGRLMDIGSLSNCGSNYYLGQNTSTNYGPGSGTSNSNSGEQILMEGWGAPQANNVYVGGVLYATPTTIQLYKHSYDCSGDGSNTAINYCITIVRGKGLGQQRYIVADNGNALFTLSSAWAVVPDQTSYVIVTNSISNFVAYKNNIQGKAIYANPNLSSSAGFEISGGCGKNLIVDSNNFNQLRAGLMIQTIADNQGSWSAQELLMTNNVVSGCINGVDMNYSALPQTNIAFGPGYQMYATVIRGNFISGCTNNGIILHPGFSDSSPYGGKILNTIVEHNNLSSGLNYTGIATQFVNVMQYKNNVTA